MKMRVKVTWSVVILFVTAFWVWVYVNYPGPPTQASCERQCHPRGVRMVKDSDIDLRTRGDWAPLKCECF